MSRIFVELGQRLGDRHAGALGRSQYFERTGGVESFAKRRLRIGLEQSAIAPISMSPNICERWASAA
jgi:hypothetical protein